MLRFPVVRRHGRLHRQLLAALASMLVLLTMVFSMPGQALAQSEPTVTQIYEAAQAGKLDQAQVMMQQVLIAHPDSGRAHFVQAELFARQGLRARARESLARAEQLAPGLPFARPQAVQALREQLAGAAAAAAAPASRAAAARDTPEFPLGLGLALGGGAIALAIVVISRRAAHSHTQAAAPHGFGTDGARRGAQTFGSAVSGAPYNAQPGYGQPYGATYGQPVSPTSPAAGGMGRQVMGGLATGAAVGAGMLAAQALGRNLMGHEGQDGHLQGDAASMDRQGNYTPLPGNSDMGGQDFGLNDTGSWDDVGGGLDDFGGGGDWDT